MSTHSSPKSWIHSLIEEGAVQTDHFLSFPNVTIDPTLNAEGYILEHLGSIVIEGEQAAEFLQGQLSADINALSSSRSGIGSHNTTAGRMISNFRIIYNKKNCYQLIMNASIIDLCIEALSKYAVFSKLTITQQDDFIALGYHSHSPTNPLSELFGENKTLYSQHVSSDATIITITPDTERYIIITDTSKITSIWKWLTGICNITNLDTWQYENISNGIVWLTTATHNQHIAQMINYHHLEGISFKKGCYTGQETIARAKYRGMNKRAMYLLSGQSELAPAAGDTIERSVGDNWRKGGTIVSAFRYDDGYTVALAILPNDLEEDTKFKHQEVIWKKRYVTVLFG